MGFRFFNLKVSSMDQFPPNSRKAREGTQQPPKRVTQVTKASAVRRKPGLGKQFTSTFIGGSANMAFHYMISNVLIPSIRDMMAEAGREGIDRLFYGDSRRGPRPGPSPYGRVQYNQPVQRTQPAVQQVLPRQARVRHAFDEILIPTRQEAEEVLDRMFDTLSQYESVNVADLYELTGIQSSHTDLKWGWTELRGASVGRARGGGYILDLPDPEPLN